MRYGHETTAIGTPCLHCGQHGPSETECPVRLRAALDASELEVDYLVQRMVDARVWSRDMPKPNATSTPELPNRFLTGGLLRERERES